MVTRILKDAADLVERGWAAGNSALDENQAEISPLHPRARCWSLEGAVEAAAEGNANNEQEALAAIRQQIQAETEDETIGDHLGSPAAYASDFNWDATHSSQVTGMLRRAALQNR